MSSRKAERADISLETMLGNIPAHFLSKDREGKFLFVNAEYAELFEKNAQELVGKTVADLYPKVFAVAARIEDERIMESGQVFEDVFEDTRDGKTYYFASRKGPIFNDNNEVVGVQTILWDITKRRAAELALLEEREKLRASTEAAMDVIRDLEESLQTAETRMGGEFPVELREAHQTLWKFLADREDVNKG